MRTSMVQNNGINNQPNFKAGIKFVNPNSTSIQKYGQIIDDLAKMDEFKKTNIHIESGAFGITATVKKFFGLLDGKSTYKSDPDITTESMKEALIELIKK